MTSPSPESTISERLVLGFFRVLATFPLGLRIALGRLLGRIFSWFPTRDRRICALQLERFIGPRAGRLTSQVYANLGQTALEFLNLAPIVKRRSEHFDLAGLRELKRMNEGGRAMVCLTGHVGNWELLSALGTAEGLPLTVIGREARNPIFRNLLRRLRERSGAQIIWRAQRPQGLRQLLEAFKAGRVVAALIDQDTRLAGSMVPFFGVPAQVPHSLIELAQRYHADLASIFLIRTPHGGKVVFETFAKDASPDEVLTEFNHRLEKVLVQNPTQWVWMHKRWRTKPTGERLSSREYLAALESGELRAYPDRSSPPQPIPLREHRA